MDTRGISSANVPKFYFKKFKKDHNLVDIWRHLYPDKRQFTWRQVSLSLFSRLDYWLISKKVCNLVQSSDIRPALKCDHNAISLKLKFKIVKRGKGFWKINNNILVDAKYQTGVRNLIKQVKLEYIQLSPQDKWEICKVKIKEFTMSYCKQKYDVKKDAFNKLKKEYDTLK